MRALIVEDDPLVADATAQALRRAGLAVDIVGDGVDGLHEATETAYDVLVLDVMLPGIDGFEIVRTLRARDVWTPVLMLTARDDDADIAAALDTGADDYLPKPFGVEVLLARVRALLRRGTRTRPVELRVGDLMLDPATRHCRRAGHAIDLTTREFTLLEFFMRHPDVVLSKTDILEHCWDSNHAGDGNVVEVYVGYLRRKIDAPFGRRSIETVRAAGYRLRSDGR